MKNLHKEKKDDQMVDGKDCVLVVEVRARLPISFFVLLRLARREEFDEAHD